MGSDDGDKSKPLTSAPPPWHSVVILTGFLGLFLWMFPSFESLDKVATMETFTRVLFPDIMDLTTVAYARSFLAITIWVVTFHMAVISDGWKQETTYQPGSRLKMTPNHLIGIKTCFPFTSVSWNLLGLYYTLSAYIAWEGLAGNTVSPLVLRTTLASWEVAAPNSLLVSSVIRYVIWPGVLKKGNDTSTLRSVRNIFMHNLNVLFAVSECALLGGVPVRWSDISLAPLVGIGYVIFTWNMSMSWNKKEHGPQFIYFFFDTTMPGYIPTIALVGLMVALLLFFAIFCSCESLLVWADAGIAGGLTFVVLICASVMRFRD